MSSSRKVSYPSPEYRRRRDNRTAPRMAWSGPRWAGSAVLGDADPASDSDDDRCDCEPVERDRRDDPTAAAPVDPAGAEEDDRCGCQPQRRERDPRASTRQTLMNDDFAVYIAKSLVEVVQEDDRCGCEESAVEVGRSNPRKRSPRTTFPAGDLVDTAELTGACEDGGDDE